jgi:hypothetical protein
MKALSLFLIPASRQRTDKLSTGIDDEVFGNICQFQFWWQGFHQLSFVLAVIL